MSSHSLDSTQLLLTWATLKSWEKQKTKSPSPPWEVTFVQNSLSPKRHVRQSWNFTCETCGSVKSHMWSFSFGLLVLQEIENLKQKLPLILAKGTWSFVFLNSSTVIIGYFTSFSKQDVCTQKILTSWFQKIEPEPYSPGYKKNRSRILTDRILKGEELLYM